MIRAGIYVRISQDREGAGLGVARQEQDCRALCERRSWTVAEIYADNDVSAYSGKPRPAWLRLVDDIKGGTIDAIAVWHVDRMTRSPRELEDVIDLADRHGTELATVTGEVDLATPTGRMVARILGATARQEAEHKAERQKRQRRQAAEAGRISGGGTRPFGYADDFVTVVDDEADVIRECAARVLAGESLSSLAIDLDGRGVRTPKGGKWQPRTLRRMLASARISGRREHKPRASSDTGTRPLLGEIVADAVWPAIITPTDSDRLRSLLSDPSRRKYSGATGRTYLLSGILRCGICGGRMNGRPRSGVPRYVCPNTPGGDTCGRTATNAERTDEHVRDLVLTALDSPDLADRLRRRDEVDPALIEAVRTDEAQLDELAAMWGAGEIGRGEWRTARQVIETRLARNRDKLARASVVAPLPAFVGTYEEMVDRWERLNVSQRRAIVAAVLIRVDVKPANRATRWDPWRFDPVWRV
jgi:site-specific DNA recombinase